MDPSFFEQNEIFRNMHPVKLQIMKDLAENMRGKPMQQAMPLLMAATSKLQSHNLSFTPEETAVLMDILTKDMSAQDKAKVEMMKNVVNKRRR